MGKRFAWILLLIVPVAVVVMMTRPQPNRPFRGEQKGFLTDLKDHEVADALQVLQNERLMWATFTSVSGEIDVKLASATGDKIYHHFAGGFSLRQTGVSSDHQNGDIWKYALVLTNSAEGWRLVTDGTAQKTTFDCKNDENATAIKSIAPALTQILTAPRRILVPLYKDATFPQGREEFKQVFGSFAPFLNTNAGGIPHSYVFKEKENRFNELLFAGGHFSGWVKVKNESGVDRLALERPFESNDFWFPTIIKVWASGNVITVELSKIAVNEN